MMSLNSLINMIWLQSLWFAAIIGAANQSTWPALLLFAAFALWHLRPSAGMTGDFRLMPAALILGFVLDTAWVRLGWLEFSAAWPVSGQAPLWILLLWAGLALTLNHSLGWLQSRLLLSSLLAGLSSPFSYLAAERLGAVRIIADSWLWFPGIGLSWAIVVPFLLWLARQLNTLPRREKSDD